MLSVPLQKGLSPIDVLGQLVAGDDRPHVVGVGGEVAVVSQEAVEEVGLVELLLPLLGLGDQTVPGGVDLLVLGIDLVSMLGVDVAQALGLLGQSGHLHKQNSKSRLQTFVRLG